MSDEKDLNVVFGAGGGLGSAVVRVLAAKGKRVRAVNRSGRLDLPGNVEAFEADAANAGSVRAACEGASVVFNCANAPYTNWPELLPSIFRGILNGAASAGAKLIIGDNLYCYGLVDGEITEDLPYAATGIKGALRGHLATEMMEAHEVGKVRLAIGRASDFFGPYSFAGAGDLVFKAALLGKKAKALGNVDMPHTWTYTEDFAKGLIKLSEEERALGEVWHIPSAETVTTREFINMVFQEVGDAPKIQAVPGWLVSIMGVFNPMMRELKEMMYEWEEPYIVSHSKYENAFGNESTPHREAIRSTLDWFRFRLK